MHYEPECYCDDHSECTTEYCDSEVGCVYVPMDCDDGDYETHDYCDSIIGCVHEEYPDEPETTGGY
jgi:hypothetical protein